MSRRRTSVIALLLGAALVVIAPTAAFAYWVISTQTALAASSATFAVSAPTSTTGTVNVLPASSADLSGFSGSTVSSAVYTNTGATPWSALWITGAATASFGSGAIVKSSVAVVGEADACPAPSVYAALDPNGTSVPVSIAAGGAAKVCVLTAYDRLSMPNRSASSATQILVSPRLQNWTVAAAALTITNTAPNAGLMRCTDSNDVNATVTFVVPQDGTYRWVDTAAGAAAPATFTAGTQQSRTFASQFLGSTGTILVTVERQVGSGWTTVAQGSVVGYSSFILWAQYRCP